jgi:DnaK suppressor protein
MDAQKLQEFRDQLEEQRKELIEKILHTVNHEIDLKPEDMADEVDLASVLADQNFNLRLRGRERRLMEKIDYAIQRIDANEFGNCVACGDSIALKRLEARPVTTMCIDCKEDEERREQHYSD